MNTIDRMAANQIIAILRGYGTEKTVQIAEHLLEGGIRTVEVTMDSPDASRTLERLDQVYDGILAGAGTVRTTEDVADANNAGAEFALSPVFEPDVVEVCKEADLPIIPGCLTPTEMMRAHREGADGIKLFPAANFGPSYLSRVITPLPDMPFVPTGGVKPENAGEYVNAGATAVGSGSFLTGGIEEHGLRSVRIRAEELLNAVA